jgi:hypothetical protein
LFFPGSGHKSYLASLVALSERSHR